MLSWLFGGGSKARTARSTRTAAPKTLMPQLGRATASELGHVVGRDEGEHLLGQKLVDNLGLPITFDYTTSAGSTMRRAVLIDGIYGSSLSCPSYIRGPDAFQKGEPRAFRIDRMHALLRGDEEPIVKDIAWWIGAMARDKLGLPLVRPPQDWTLDRPLAVRTSRPYAQPRVTVGRATAATLRYVGAGEVLTITVRGKSPEGGRARTVRAACGAGADEFYDRVEEAWDPESGEVIQDLLGWLDAQV